MSAPSRRSGARCDDELTAHAVDARRVREDPRWPFPGFITGKPVGMGGSLGRTEATGYGVVFTLREALKELGIRPDNTNASVQGFGNVARYAIELYTKLGGKVIAVACWDQSDQCSYTYRKLDGINLDQLLSITDRFGGINKTKAEDSGTKCFPAAPGLNRTSIF